MHNEVKQEITYNCILDVSRFFFHFPQFRLVCPMNPIQNIVPIAVIKAFQKSIFPCFFFPYPLEKNCWLNSIRYKSQKVKNRLQHIGHVIVRTHLHARLKFRDVLNNIRLTLNIFLTYGVEKVPNQKVLS